MTDLEFEEQETLRHERELELLADQFPTLVEQAKLWQPGMFRSAYTLPLQRHLDHVERIIKFTGVAPVEVKSLGRSKADHHEPDLPDHILEVYKRGRDLLNPAKIILSEKRKDIAARKAEKAHD